MIRLISPAKTSENRNKSAASMFIGLFLALIPSLLLANDKQIHWAIGHYPPRFIVEAPGKFGGQAGLQHEILEIALPEYQHNYHELTYAEFIRRLSQQENICTSMILKTPEREKLAHFSIPWHIDLPIAAAITRDAWQRIGKPAKIRMRELLQHEQLKGGIEEQRSYGTLDKLINNASINQNMKRYELVSSQILPLLQTGGIDYTLEYPYLSHYYLRTLGTENNIISVSLEDGFPYVFGYIACTANSWGAERIAKLNKVIAQERKKSGYLRLLQMLYPQQSDRDKVAEIFHQYFINSK